MCFVWIWEQTAIISLYSTNWKEVAYFSEESISPIFKEEIKFLSYHSATLRHYGTTGLRLYKTIR